MVCLSALVAALVAAGLLGAAILAPAPVAVLPLLAVACVGLPMLATWQLARVHAAVGGLASAIRRGDALDERALHDLRRALERLPETSHPLDR
jgi:uncharacterized membrane protein AbrB (regulator of aidB expression)